MKKRFAAVLLALIVGVVQIAPLASYAATKTELKSITWQDPGSAVLQWDAESNTSYKVYRSDRENGKYVQIGQVEQGAYLDLDVEYPNTYWYKIESIGANGKVLSTSKSMKIGTNPQPVNRVAVIMYHHFITDEDQANGVVYDEYATTPEEFEADLKYLRNNGYTTITSDDLLEYIHGNKPLPAKSIIISIDDGTEGVYTNCWPLLKKYNMKADLNVIGEQVDIAWETVHEGNSRVGEEAPYCTWVEVNKMVKSGEINLCSHTYGLHKYNRKGRIGLNMIDGETTEEYRDVINKDYKLILSSMEGWTGIVPRTIAYPYSKRSVETDEVILANTSFELLMAGDAVRATEANFFVEGAGTTGSYYLINRPCRLDGIPVWEYLEEMDAKDFSNGVNSPVNTLTISKEKSDNIAKNYTNFKDVKANDWFAGSVYYAYVNGILTGSSASEFSPQGTINRGMLATLLHRMAECPEVSVKNQYDDLEAGAWYTNASLWADKTGILPAKAESKYNPNGVVAREEVALSLYNYAKEYGIDIEKSVTLENFADEQKLSEHTVEAMQWAVATGIFKGNEKKQLNPKDTVTRAEMATILQSWNLNMN